MRKIHVILLITLLLPMILYGCTSSNESENSKNGSDKSSDTDNSKEEKPTLTFGVTPWTSTIPPTEIAKNLLEDMGYKVEEVELNLGVVFSGLSVKDVDIFMDFWMPNQKQYIDEYSDSVEILSTSYEDADWGLVVPEYMEDINDIGDLKGKEDLVNNEVLTIEASDPSTEDVTEVIDEYDLDIEVVNSSEAPMLAASMDKIGNKEPVLFYGWRPHSMFENLDIKILTHNKAPELFPSSTIHVVSHKELKEEAPEAYEFLSNWNIPIDDVEDMISTIDQGEKPEDVAQTWIDNNQDKVDKMIENN